VANFYFLIIAILSLFEFSPVHPVTNVGPLVMVIGISMLKEAVEDTKRHKKDNEVNSTPILVLRDGSFSWRPSGLTSRSERSSRSWTRAFSLRIC